MVWTHCQTFNAVPEGLIKNGVYLAPVTGVPFDESPFGIRDLAGSVSEWTSGKPHPDYRETYRSRRGGHHQTQDAYEFRVATRNGLKPNLSRGFVGIRLVAEPR